MRSKMVYSYHNLCLSVRRVTEINKGKKTPGLDNFLIKTKEDRYRLILFMRKYVNRSEWNPTPVKRTYTPKRMESFDHSSLLSKISGFFPLDLLPRWIKAGYVNKNVFHETNIGTRHYQPPSSTYCIRWNGKKIRCSV